MMAYYHVKNGAGLFGVPDDSVERFSDQKAGPLVREGKIEPFNPKKHADKPGADAAQPAQGAA